MPLRSDTLITLKIYLKYHITNVTYQSLRLCLSRVRWGVITGIEPKPMSELKDNYDGLDEIIKWN